MRQGEQEAQHGAVCWKGQAGQFGSDQIRLGQGLRQHGVMLCPGPFDMGFRLSWPREPGSKSSCRSDQSCSIWFERRTRQPNLTFF